MHLFHIWNAGASMDWNDIRLVLEIARAGSFTGAAAALATSKPTVSRKISEIEQAARVRLFQRMPHGVTLTAAGEALVRQATRVETEALDYEKLLRTLGHDATAPITVEMSEGVAHFLMTPAVAKQELGPLGIAALKSQIRLPPLKMVTSGANPPGDIALRWTTHDMVPSRPPTEKVRKLTDVSFIPFYSKAYGQNKKPPKRFEDLTSHRLITLDAYSGFRRQAWEEWHHMIDDREGMRTQWTASLGHLIQGGAGIGVLPTYVPMYSDAIQPLDIKTPPMFASLWITCSDNAYKEPRIRDCFSQLSKLFAEADWMLN